jgi:hypothetical protein
MKSTDVDERRREEEREGDAGRSGAVEGRAHPPPEAVHSGTPPPVGPLELGWTVPIRGLTADGVD